MSVQNKGKIRQAVREAYKNIAISNTASCVCDDSCCCDTNQVGNPDDQAIGMGYSQEDVSSVPQGANMGLGCGNPKVIAGLKAGETVLDLGSGGGFDCFLAAKAVGETGYVIGVDMTPEMIEKARANAEKLGINNVEFRLGEIEHIPAPDESVDVIISNCVINLSPEKENVFKESFRVLKPGGRLAVSDIVAKKPMPEYIRKDLELYTSCMAGAALIDNLKSILKKIGFSGIQIKPLDLNQDMKCACNCEEKTEDYVTPAYIEAVKPK